MESGGKHTLSRASSAASERYEPLLPHSDRSQSAMLILRPGATITHASANANANANSSSSSSATTIVHASILDVPVGTTVATGIAIDPSSSAAAVPGQLVFMPDLPNVVAVWHGQRLLMVFWLVSSLFSLVLFAPLFMAFALFLAAEIAAVLGIVASVVHLCERGLAASNTLELGAQIKLVASCGTVAAFLDAFTVVLDLLVLWRMDCSPDDFLCMSVAKFALVFALSCAHHGAVSWCVAHRAHSIMPLLNPVTSGVIAL